MPDTRPRNSEGQFSPDSGGGASPGSFQAAYNPAIIMQNNEQRQAILAAVQKRKQQQGVEGTEPSGASDTVMSARLGLLVELASFYSETLREVDNIAPHLAKLKGRLAPNATPFKQHFKTKYPEMLRKQNEATSKEAAALGLTVTHGFFPKHMSAINSLNAIRELARN